MVPQSTLDIVSAYEQLKRTETNATPSGYANYTQQQHVFHSETLEETSGDEELSSTRPEPDQLVAIIKVASKIISDAAEQLQLLCPELVNSRKENVGSASTRTDRGMGDGKLDAISGGKTVDAVVGPEKLAAICQASSPAEATLISQGSLYEDCSDEEESPLSQKKSQWLPLSMDECGTDED